MIERLSEGKKPLSQTVSSRQPMSRVTRCLVLLAVCLGVLTGIRWLRPYLSRVHWLAQRVPYHQVILYDLGTVIVPYGLGDRRLASRTPITLSHQFVVRNPSKEQPLVLTLRSKSCDCLGASPPPPIEPGGQAIVQLAMKPRSGSERRREEVTFHTNLPRPRQITLVLAAQVVWECELGGQPSTHVPYGGPYYAEADLFHHNRWSRPPAQAVIATDNPDVQVTWISAWQTSPLTDGVYRHQRRFRMDIHGLAQNELRGGSLITALRIDLEGKRYEVSRQFTTHPPLRIMPAELLLASDPQRLRLHADMPFRIGEPYDTRRLLRCTLLTSDLQTTHELLVSLSQIPEEDLVETVLHIPTKGLSIAEVVVPVYVFGETGRSNKQ